MLMDWASAFDRILDDGWSRPLPNLCPREVDLLGFPGKADAIVGMRRVGKTSLLLHHMASRLSAGVPRRSMVYVSFEDDRLIDLQAADLHHLDEAALRRGGALRGDAASERWFYLDEVQNVPG
jgi:predicted AAA+ superfamily ATPase